MSVEVNPKAKKLKGLSDETLNGCKHYIAVSAGVMGKHSRCMNEKSAYYGTEMPICGEECCGFEK